MIVAIDARSIYAGMGGIGYVMANLLPALARLDGANQYRILNFQVPHREYLPDAPANFTFTDYSLLQRKLFNLATEWVGWPRIQSLLGRVDLVHFPSFSFIPCGDTPYVVTVHDLAFEHFPQFISQRNLSLARQNARRLCAGARHIIAISQATRLDLMQLYAVPAAKISVVYLGTNAFDWPTPAAAQLAARRQQWGLEKKGMILFVGTIEPRKNIPFLLQAFARFPHRQDFDLVLAGGIGWNWQEVFATIKQLGLEQDVHHLGYVSAEDLAALYSCATMFVFPSHYEGFGLPCLDAMARGVPVLAADNSSLPEVVGDAGILFPLDDPDRLSQLMTSMVADPEKLAQMRERGYRQARRFSWETCARQVKEVYEMALN